MTIEEMQNELSQAEGILELKDIAQKYGEELTTQWLAGFAEVSVAIARMMVRVALGTLLPGQDFGI